MKSMTGRLALIGVVLFGVLTLWSAYWAVSLRYRGCLVTGGVVAREEVVDALSGAKYTAVKCVYKWPDGHNEEVIHKMDLEDAPRVGERVEFYWIDSSSGLLGVSRVPADWRYAWMPPVLFIVHTGALLWFWWMIPRRHSNWYRYIWIFALILGVLCIYLADPFTRVLQIRDYVVRMN